VVIACQRSPEGNCNAHDCKTIADRRALQFQVPVREALPATHTRGPFRKMDYHDTSAPMGLPEARATRLPTGVTTCP
jgi:hypothetical protein